ncbi:AGR220Cp [Eremothecium gossypii ATCC 10895]|uniref:AGR220Cp n=1 Tax=Eremothecium gossypii (strain ATCC 10895 / CBS 109.51 / FGSC 9923 / NRRL Y-1056) TaxID=284811 RepID=Q74ZI2_EREGS|nr:AGR220Cp [Eremothecium gossypii ATCC 10895]AAS54710.2 AGR220Cp [Eremothecium gossypii ATCC 10895]AEY99040.1 FAGR220Cp [Eremothecium gossypii FDAG1]
MVSALIRGLLRDWKRMQYAEGGLGRWIRPQENNVHVWHLVLYDGMGEREIYCMCYVGERGGAPVVVLRSCTPNSYVPLQRNVCGAPVARELAGGGGLAGLYRRVAGLFFGVAHRESAELMRAWNRVVCREFRAQFGALCGGALSATGLAQVREYLAEHGRERAGGAFGARAAELVACDGGARSADTQACDSETDAGARAAKRQRAAGRAVPRGACEEEARRRRRA